MNQPGANLNPCNVQVPLFLEKEVGMSSLETLFAVSLFSAHKEAPRAELAACWRRRNLVGEVVLVGCSSATHSLGSFRRILARVQKQW